MKRSRLAGVIMVAAVMTAMMFTLGAIANQGEPVFSPAADGVLDGVRGDKAVSGSDGVGLAVDGRSLEEGGRVVDGKLYLPAEELADVLGLSLNWDREAGSAELETDAAEEYQEITVSTAEEFVAALGSNRKIILDEGEYMLSDAVSAPGAGESYRWDQTYDGYELAVKGLYNLTIEGAGDEPSHIIVEPRYAYIMKFEDSQGITLKNIRAGHTEAGECIGGVFSFFNCSDINLDEVHMYGCGTEGLALDHVSDMTVRNSSIYECTVDIMQVNGSRNVVFENCDFYDNRGWVMLSVVNTSGFAVRDSRFENNTANTDMISISDSPDAVFENCEFSGNTVGGEAWTY